MGESSTYDGEKVIIGNHEIDIGGRAKRWDITDGAISALGVMFPGLLEGKLTRESFFSSFGEDETLEDVLKSKGFFIGPVTIVHEDGGVGKINQVECVRGFIYELLQADDTN